MRCTAWSKGYSSNPVISLARLSGANRNDGILVNLLVSSHMYEKLIRRVDVFQMRLDGQLLGFFRLITSDSETLPDRGHARYDAFDGSDAAYRGSITVAESSSSSLFLRVEEGDVIGRVVF